MPIPFPHNLPIVPIEGGVTGLAIVEFTINGVANGVVNLDMSIGRASVIFVDGVGVRWDDLTKTFVNADLGANYIPQMLEMSQITGYAQATHTDLEDMPTVSDISYRVTL